MGMFDSDKTATETGVTNTSDVAWSSDEDKMAFHYSEARRLLAKAEGCIGGSDSTSAETLITVARMHLHIWADLKSIATTGNISPAFKRETVHSGGSSYTQ